MVNFRFSSYVSIVIKVARHAQKEAPLTSVILADLTFMKIRTFMKISVYKNAPLGLFKTNNNLIVSFVKIAENWIIF